MENVTENRLGEVTKNRLGYKMEICEYISDIDLWVKFTDGYKVHTNWQRFKMGWVRNPNNKTIYKKGYMGIGQYNSKDHFKAYNVWQLMLDRCYNPEKHKKYPTYRKCTVCKKWLNFQEFAKWYYRNYWQFEDDSQPMHIDKDIRQPGISEKIYSPKTCLIVPKFINSIFETKSKFDGLPTGISKRYNRYIASCHNWKKSFATLEEAKAAYKQQKERYVQSVAEQYKDKLPDKVYNAMMRWKYIEENNDR
jgi:hypothetical protein